jgi:hypothetical protein
VQPLSQQVGSLLNDLCVVLVQSHTLTKLPLLTWQSGRVNESYSKLRLAIERIVKVLGGIAAAVLLSLTRGLAMLAVVPILPLKGPDDLRRPNLLLLPRFPSATHEGCTCP